ncbi:hypothetical protein BH10BAC6_BH10BAC6_16830 [soil metagenome]
MAGFLFVLVCGFACTYVVMEPYPSPILPGFARVPDEQDTVNMEEPRIVIVQDDHVGATITAQELFATTRNVNAIELLRTTFYHEQESPVIARAEGTGLYHALKAFRRITRDWLASAVPSVARSLRRNGSVPASTRQWLFARIATLRPALHARTVRIEWYETDATVPFDVVEVTAP